MVDEQAEISRRIGVSLQEKGGQKKGITRRQFLFGAAAVTAAALTGSKLYNAVDKITWDPHNADHLRDFLGSQEIFPGWHSYYLGKVTLKAGTVMYNKPAYWQSEEPEGGLITTRLSANTRLGELREGDQFTIDRPFIFLQRPIEGFSSQVQEIVGPAGVRQQVDLGYSWVVFSLNDPGVPEYISKDVSASPYRVAATPIGNANLEFVSPGGENKIIPAGLDITFEQQINFGRISR